MSNATPKGEAYTNWLEECRQKRINIYKDMKINKMPIIDVMRKYDVSSTTVYKQVSRVKRMIEAGITI